MYWHDLFYTFFVQNNASWSLDSLTLSGNINKILVIITCALEFMEKTNK